MLLLNKNTIGSRELIQIDIGGVKIKQGFEVSENKNVKASKVEEFWVCFNARKLQ